MVTTSILRPLGCYKMYTHNKTLQLLIVGDSQSLKKLILLYLPKPIANSINCQHYVYLNCWVIAQWTQLDTLRHFNMYPMYTILKSYYGTTVYNDLMYTSMLEYLLSHTSGGRRERLSC